MANSIGCYVITHNTKDFGDKYVVRIHHIAAGKLTPDPEPLAVVDTLEAARGKVPKHLVCLPRIDADDPVIVESWM